MTAKRFKFNGATNCIEYNGKSILLDSYGEDIEELLNELHEDYQDAITTLFKVKEENEQLKSSDTITDLETEIMKLKTTIQQLTNDNTKQKKKLNTIMKENEQLKCGNKNLKATLNDFINICNRLQSNPNNEQTLNVARDMLQNMGKELKE
jgi:regulator of replication initiation timing